MKKYLLLTILLLLLSAGTADAAVEISDGSVKALWHLEDTADSSGNGFNFTATGGSFTCTGKLGTGCWDSTSATGGSHNLQRASSTGLIITSDGDFTLGYWFNQQTGPTAGYYVTTALATKGVATGYNRMCFVSLEFKVDTTCQTTPAFTPNTGEWIFYMVARTGSRVEHYRGSTTLELITTITEGDAIVQNAPFRVNGATDDTVGEDFLIDELFYIDAYISTSTRDAIFNGGDGDEICVTADCSAAPHISLSPTSFSFNTESTSGTLTITNNGGGSLSWTITSTQPWLTFSTNSGTIVGNNSTGTTRFRTNLWGYASGTHYATATVSSSNATNSPQTVSVTGTVGGGGAAEGGGGGSYWFLNLKEITVPRHLTLYEKARPAT